MAANIISAFITLLINIAAGVAVFFFMLLAMNGYHESDATCGIVAYFILAAMVTIFMSAGAFFMSRYLVRKQCGSVVSVLIAIPVFSFSGIVLKLVCSIIGVGVAEYVRLNF